MDEETPAKRGEAAWKDHREAISKRNAAARKRGRAEQESQVSVGQLRSRARARHEAEELRLLNAQIARRRVR
jgi:hypothetical protein